MTSQIAHTAGWMSVACVLVLWPTLVSSSGSGTCRNEGRQSLAIGVEGTISPCTETMRTGPQFIPLLPWQLPVVRSECVGASRQDGPRPADRLESDIERCLSERIGPVGQPE
jgi:hypothetical protein